MAEGLTRLELVQKKGTRRRPGVVLGEPQEEVQPAADSQHPDPPIGHPGPESGSHPGSPQPPDRGWSPRGRLPQCEVVVEVEVEVVPVVAGCCLAGCKSTLEGRENASVEGREGSIHRAFLGRLCSRVRLRNEHGGPPLLWAPALSLFSDTRGRRQLAYMYLGNECAWDVWLCPGSGGRQAASEVGGGR